MIHDHVAVAGIGCSCLDVEVKNPRTHIDKGKALYTDYEIELKTNHPSFPLLNSKTRRRYSEFIWLRSKLGLPDVRVQGGTPKLPGKQLIGRFKDSFLEARKDGLERFLIRLLSVNTFLQEPALALFLQTNLSIKEMEHYLKTRTPGAIKSLITRLHTKSKKDKKVSSRKTSLEYPLPKRKHKKTYVGGRGWSSQYGDGYYSLPLACSQDCSTIDEDVRQRSSTVNYASALPGGQLTLPTIPGSTEDLPLSSSTDFTTTTDDEVEDENIHPLSASWHGCERDDVDFILDDYEVLPYEIVTQIEEKHQAEVEELGYLDLTTTTDVLNSYTNEQDFFDY